MLQHGEMLLRGLASYVIIKVDSVLFAIFFIHHTATENEAAITKRRMSLPIKLLKLLLFVLAA